MTTLLGRRIATQQTILAGEKTPDTNVHYLKLLQVWQWEGMNIEQALINCRDWGYTGLLVKALDGPYWMNGIDPSAEALGAIVDVERHVQLAHEAGLYYFCWTNPRQFDIEMQATVTAAIAEASDGVFLDVEPYTQFWGPWAPVGAAEAFVADIRNRAPTAWIAIQPDPRPNALAAIRIGEWMPYVDAISGQHYWSDFHSDATAELIHAQALGELYGKPSLPTLPGNAPYSSFPWPLISHLPGFVVWRMGTTPNATLLRLGSTPVMGLKSDKLDWSDE